MVALGSDLIRITVRNRDNVFRGNLNEGHHVTAEATNVGTASDVQTIGAFIMPIKVYQLFVNGDVRADLLIDSTSVTINIMFVLSA